MSFKQTAMVQADRSQRSVFVGNISYEVQEETIRQIFHKIGSVLSLKMVHDRETGKPKGYGFVEFPDVQTAELAIRNLNGYELNGRPLRVDSAAGGERSADEITSLQATLGPQEENPYGPETETSKTPEVISRCVASLPPEKMFDLMKQMKEVVRANPNEVKEMLSANPQLAYALLQAQVVMRIVDPQVAIAMLHRETPTQLTPFHQQVPPHAAPPHAQQPNFGMPPPASNLGMPLPPSNFRRPPPTFAPPPPAQQHQEISMEEQINADLLLQVMQLNEDEISQLPPGDREKVIELRNQLRTVR